MPRDNHCDQCGGMFHDDEMDGWTCVYCSTGTESGQKLEDEDDG